MCLNRLVLLSIGLSLDVPLSGCLVELAVRDCGRRWRQVGLGGVGLLSIRRARRRLGVRMRLLSIRSATQGLASLSDLGRLLRWLPKNRASLLLNRLGSLSVRQHTRHHLTLRTQGPLL
jgi:hypothetical protein